MTYHFYFKNSEPVYETEYKQSLKQFAVQEVFPTYVLKIVLSKERKGKNKENLRRYILFSYKNVV